MHSIFHDFLHALTHADKGIFLLFKYLTIQPGKIAREYVDGRRKKYFNPFSFLVLMVGVTFFLILKFEKFALRHEDFRYGNREIILFSFKYFNVLIFLMCPVSALLSWLLFRKYKFFYAEHLVLWAYLTGQQMFYMCLGIVPLCLDILLGFIPLSVTITVWTILINIWIAFGLIQFHHTKSLADLVKVIIVVVLSQILLQGMVYFGLYLFGASLSQLSNQDS
ncbi:MAG TPA: DUF3667 domain-containing protein [Chitinophagaceae bacterium]|nr:DUF3667 domain-containing protein [Chitinophagaceae bacterium]